MAKSKMVMEGIYCGAKFYSFTRLIPYFRLIVCYLLNYPAGWPYKSVATWPIGKTATLLYTADQPHGA